MAGFAAWCRVFGFRFCVMSNHRRGCSSFRLRRDLPDAHHCTLGFKSIPESHDEVIDGEYTAQPWELECRDNEPTPNTTSPLKGLLSETTKSYVDFNS